ncbi:unnamed protein product [Cyclocybe aegerita]|uniref:Uncharacterized protein n=1 Tax=Cyclocybe aegerita TaxID=1973307 RepID=A0A8S0WAT3_CYCAE|nr:unnamed protein product [Cyclocybe aegerita]
MPHSSSIQHVDISGCFLQVADAEIRQFCESGQWASLVTLRLPKSLPCKAPTLKSLEVLATHCPFLIMLVLNLELTADNIRAARKVIEQTPPLQHKLRKQVLQRLEEDDLHDVFRLGVMVAEYLDHFFPFLKGLKPLDYGAEWWNGIGDILKTYRQRRSQQQ